MKRVIAILAIFMMVVSETAVCYAGKAHHTGKAQNVHGNKGHYEATATDVPHKEHRHEATATDVQKENGIIEIPSAEQGIVEDNDEVKYDKELEMYIKKCIRGIPYDMRTLDPELEILKKQLHELKQCYPEYSYDQLSNMLDDVENERDYKRLLGIVEDEEDEYAVSLLASNASTSTGSVIGNSWNSVYNYQCITTRVKSDITTFATLGSKLNGTTGIIPGLEVTVFKNGNTCNDMVPQGICVADDFILISADCCDNDNLLTIKVDESLTNSCNSVVYVIQKSNMKFLCTLELDTKCHVGGIAFDSINKVLWVCDSNNNTMIRYKLSALKEVANTIAKTSTQAYLLNRTSTHGVSITPSYCTYFDGMLWVGNYSKTGSSTVKGYVYDGKTLTEGAQFTCPQYSQGITFKKYGSAIFCAFSTSHWGADKSVVNTYVIQNYDKRKQKGTKLGTSLMKCISMPPLMEEMQADGNCVYSIFESCSNKWSPITLLECDRICPFYATFIFK